MGIRWTHSIRWRLALWSMLISLLATGLLALAAIIAIAHYYGADQRNQLTNLSVSGVQEIDDNFGHTLWTVCNAQNQCVRTRNLAKSANAVLSTPTKQNSQYLYIVYDNKGRILYPTFAPNRTDVVTNFLFQTINPNPENRQSNVRQLLMAIKAGIGGTTTSGTFGGSSFAGIGQPFVVHPLRYTSILGKSRVIGVLVMIPRSAAETTIPPFIAAVGITVGVASLVVAIIAALAAILFSQTIIRPLGKLTRAAHALATGDYNTRVVTDAKGEIGDLAHSFNEMAAQLNRDVEELRRQEVWRRELIMSITHDLATPLTAIAGLGESLVDGVNQGREDYEATGRIIVRETLRLRRLVKDLHVMAKVEARALQPQRKLVRLAGLVDETLAALATEFERAQVEPCNAVPFSLPLVPVDPDMLTRVFANLFDNALRHTPKGGMITVDAAAQESSLFVSVTDTGEGIPPEALSWIFERFYRADSARQSKTGGSGLGLAIVRAIVEAHGGRIWAENAAGAGARISFTLPLAVGGSRPIDQVTTLPIFDEALPINSN